MMTRVQKHVASVIFAHVEQAKRDVLRIVREVRRETKHLKHTRLGCFFRQAIACNASPFANEVRCKRVVFSRAFLRSAFCARQGASSCRVRGIALHRVAGRPRFPGTVNRTPHSTHLPSRTTSLYHSAFLARRSSRFQARLMTSSAYFPISVSSASVPTASGFERALAIPTTAVATDVCRRSARYASDRR